MESGIKNERSRLLYAFGQIGLFPPISAKAKLSSKLEFPKEESHMNGTSL